MDYLGERGSARLSEVTRDLEMSRATTFRTLATLERHGYVTHRREARSFRLGPTISELARGLAATSLAELGSPALSDLHARTGETVNLALLRRDRLVYAAIVEGRHSLRMSGRVGDAVPLHATALGKAVLASLPAGRRDRLLGPPPWDAFTPGTITDRDRLGDELDGIAERGFAVDVEEMDIGAACVAAAIEGEEREPLGALSISAVTARHSEADMVELGPSVRRWADAIGRTVREGRTDVGADTRAAEDRSTHGVTAR